MRLDRGIMMVFEHGSQRVNDAKEFHLKVAEVVDSMNEKLCIIILRHTTEAFNECHVVWAGQEEHCFRHGELYHGQKCLKSKLSSIAHRFHTQIISKFAHIHYRSISTTTMQQTERGLQA